MNVSKKSLRPCPLTVAALRRAGPAPCLGRTVELALAERVQVRRCEGGQEREHRELTPPLWCGCGAMPFPLPLATCV